jgi:hypothetical protein
VFTSFEAGATFRIIDQVTPTLAKMSGEMRAFKDLVKSTRNELSLLGRSPGLRQLATMLGTIRTEMQGVTAASGAMSRAISGNFGTMNARLATSTANVNSLTAALGRAAAAATAIRATGPLIPRGGASGGGGGRGPGSHAGVGLGSIGYGVPMAAGHASAHFRGQGVGPMVAGGVGLWAGAKLFEAATEPLHQEAMLPQLGLTAQQIPQAREAAWRTARAVPGTTYAEALKIIGEQSPVLGFEGALDTNEMMARASSVLKRVGKGSDDDVMKLTRSGELLGQFIDPSTHLVDRGFHKRFLDWATQAVIGTHGMVTPSEILNLAKQGGPALGSLSREGFFTEVAIAQAMGGNRAGTAAAALQRQFAGGKMTGSVAEELMALGIAKPGDLTIGRGGHVFAKADAMKDFVDRLQRDPLSGFTDVLIPALERAGVDTAEKFGRMTYRIFGTGPAQREAYELYRGREQIRRERNFVMGGMGVDAAKTVQHSSDFGQATQNFTSAWETLMGAVGSPMAKAAIPAMNAFADAFKGLAETAAGHPKVSNVVGDTLLGASAGALLGGAAGFFIGGVGAVPGAMLGARIGAGIGAGYGIFSSDAAGPAWPDGTPARAPGSRRDMNPGRVAAHGLDSFTLPAPVATVKVEAPVVIKLDEQKVGEAVINFVVQGGKGAIGGSPYFDPSSSSIPFDLVHP